jgi:putative glutamine amidotransferase
MIRNKKLLVVLFFICTSGLSAQNYFRESYDAQKVHILLANPTTSNLKTVNYLIKNKIFKLNQKKIQFVGVYHEDQEYDFGASARYINEEKLNHFALHEVRGDINTEDVYRQNRLSSEIRYLFNHSAGIFFLGGADIPPDIYEEENTLSVVTTPVRHKFETTFLFHLLGGYRNESHVPFLEDRPDYLVTGFCLGMQTMNVATGGTLVQDIPSEVYFADTPESVVCLSRDNIHRNYWQEIVNDTQLMTVNFHPVLFTGHPFFGKRVRVSKKSRPLVYSSHHQAAEKLGKGLEVTALSADGKVVEALAHSTYPHVYAVQFHPEVSSLYENDKALKFHPDDQPASYPGIIGRKGLKFHRSYWKYTSRSLKKSIQGYASSNKWRHSASGNLF